MKIVGSRCARPVGGKPGPERYQENLQLGLEGGHSPSGPQMWSVSLQESVRLVGG